MFGVRKGLALLAGAAGAGVLIWLAARVTGDVVDTAGDYWAVVLLAAAAGLVLAVLPAVARMGDGLRPVISPVALVLGFLPALVAGGFVLVYGQPDGGWRRGAVHSFAADLGIGGLAGDIARFAPVIAFGLGALLALTLDARPVAEEPLVERRRPVRRPVDEPAERVADSERETVVTR